MKRTIRFLRLRWQERVIFFFVLPLLFAGPALAAGPYTNSAHGSSSSGVCRTGICVESSSANSGYSRGNCANCHEQHASIGGTTITPSPYMLFADSTTPYLSQNENVCFYCHASTSSLQVGGITNYDFSKTFGGAVATISSIQGAFNITSPSSHHNLADIYQYITGTDTNIPKDTHAWANFPLSSSPCSGCHNVHIAKRNKSTPGNPVNTAISKPSDHGNLWGDGAGETLSDYATSNAASYQPPYYSGSLNTYEPDGAGLPATPGSNMPDYITFCTDCHNAGNTIYSTTLGRDLIQINWSNSGTGADQHGSFSSIYVSSGTGTRALKPPYSSTTTNYVLSCLDCHEPHGSPNITLLRRKVNGGDLAGAITAALPDQLSPASAGDNHNNEMGYLCMRCHTDDSYYGGTANQWEWVHHKITGYPYKKKPGPCWSCHGGSPWSNPIECDKCHFHGATDAWLKNYYSSRVTGWKTF